MANNVLPDPVNVNIASPDPVNTNPVAKDFYYEASKGAITGVSIMRVDSVNPNISSLVTADLWFAGGVLSYPTAGEQWEVVSSSADDAAAGIGAQQIIITYLDDSYLEQSETVALNGTTPVAMVATNAFRPTRITSGFTRVSAVGSNAKNVGDITIRVAGGGAIRQSIPADTNRSLDCHYTVPDGKFMQVIGFTTSMPKNRDAVFSLDKTTGEDGIFLSSLPIGVYQATITESSTAPIFYIPARSDLKISVRTESNNTKAAANILFAIEDL